MRVLRKIVFGVCLTSLCFSSVVFASDLFYDAESGEIFLNVISDQTDRFSGFEMSSGAGRFVTENYRRLGGPTDLFRLSPTGITEGGAFVGGYENGLYRLGAIYPENVSDEEFISDVSAVWAELGSTTTQLFATEFGRPSGIPLNDDGVQQIDRWATSVSLLYWEPTGELILSSDGENGGYINAFGIHGTFTDIATFDEGGRFTATNGKIESFGLVPPGTYSFGEVLPSNLTQQELSNSLSSADFIAEASDGQIAIEREGIAMNISIVPEPTSCFATLLGCLTPFVLRQRRRDSSP